MNPKWSEEHYIIGVACYRTSCQLNPDPLVCRLNQDLTFLPSSTLSDFHIVSTLALGEFGHIDLVGIDLALSHNDTDVRCCCCCLFKIPCFYNVNLPFSPVSGAAKEQHQVSFSHESP